MYPTKFICLSVVISLLFSGCMSTKPSEQWVELPEGLYHGDVSNNPPHGKGVLKLKGGNLYRGKFKSGYMHGKGVFTWSDGKIYSFRSKAGRREATFGNYINGPKMVYSALKFYPVKGKHVLVVGSAPHPWMEAIMLEFGARKVPDWIIITRIL